MLVYPLDFVLLVIDHCGFTNLAHRDLLHPIFGEKNLKQLKVLSQKEGIHIPEEALEETAEKKGRKRKYTAPGSEDLVLPPSSKRVRGPDDILKLYQFKSISEAGERSARGFESHKRSLQTRIFEKSQGLVISNTRSKPTTLHPAVVFESPNHARYFGELMASKALDQ
ncbi:hypothetical protein FANTH_10176 [Fusarium anthophilum]|uniref:Uncharacterized protein n=1 Tax=Fusarium anthophilum TaxID=48485 RepID=A0A8H5DWX9_9HYPO|nr:hypothetical protein FANTH_10176 [Fusarium anthophilum]